MPSRALLDETEAEVRALLAERLQVRSDDTEAIGIHSAVKMLRTIPLDQMQGLMFILATATLVIGAVGVLNMMLDSVYERRQEIGVRLAVGARRRDIIAQFFLETFAITALGGLVGAALGVGTCLVLGGLDAPEMIPVPVLNPRIVVVALSVMGGVGLAAGVIPAWRAARVDPALTLRME